MPHPIWATALKQVELTPIITNKPVQSFAPNTGKPDIPRQLAMNKIPLNKNAVQAIQKVQNPLQPLAGLFWPG